MTRKNLTIHTLSVVDHDAIYGLQNAELASMGWGRDGLEAILGLKTTLALGVRDEAGELIAFVITQWMVDEADILSFAVRSSFQRQGMGAYLWTMLEADLAARGIHRIFLDVAVNNHPAVAFYRRQGFNIKGRRPDYYTTASGEKVEALTMSKML